MLSKKNKRTDGSFKSVGSSAARGYENLTNQRSQGQRIDFVEQKSENR